MIKKIRIDQVVAGVYVHDFNCGWLHHPFLVNRIKLNTDKDVEKILKYGIRELYIDTEKGLDIDAAPTKQEADSEIQTELDQLSMPTANSEQPSRLSEEITRAKKLITEAKRTTQRLMGDVKLGKQIEMHQVEKIVEQMTESVLNNKDALISLLRIKTADEYTYTHSLAVSALCISFARQLDFDADQIRQIGVGGLLHDIGKMKVPGEILNKPGPLTEKEFEIMKTHVKEGDRILNESTNLDAACICVTAHHHERLDGTGYPEGLKGDGISLFGQVAAIVDIYDALSSERCYKVAMSPHAALRKIFEWSQGYLNRNLVEKFIAHVGIYPIGTLVRLKSGYIGVVIDHGEKGSLTPVVRAVCDAVQRRPIKPFVIDLGIQRQIGNEHDIVGCEAPEKWHVKPEQYV
ncbi:MAG TPA: HD-GYP domain-containing protein [Candidatus Saccharimonadales bacterium]|nr:HD-GYP domain-containing protein [Candidatus Saccharimonadales bacterium]